MNFTLKAKFPANSPRWLLSDLLLSITCDRSLSLHCHAASHKPPVSMATWAARSQEKGEWAGLTSVWPFTRGQCQLANMAHSILPYGAIAYVPLARTRGSGPAVSRRCERGQTPSAADPHAEWTGCTAHSLTCGRIILLLRSHRTSSHWNTAVINTPVCFLFWSIKMSAVQPVQWPPVDRHSGKTFFMLLGPVLMRLCIKILLNVIMSNFYSKVNKMPTKSWKDPLIEGLCSARQIIFVFEVFEAGCCCVGSSPVILCCLSVAQQRKYIQQTTTTNADKI